MQAKDYRGRLLRWDGEKEGESIKAAKGCFRGCLYHIDFDEYPTYSIDLQSLEQGQHLIDNFHELFGDMNVDYGAVFDDTGKMVISGRPY